MTIKNMKGKYIYPKIKKNFSDFMTDESGKVSKANALGLGVAGIFLGTLDSTDAHHCNTGGSVNQSYAPRYNNGITGPFYQGLTCGHNSGVTNNQVFNVPAPINNSWGTIQYYGGGNGSSLALPSGSNYCPSSGAITNSETTPFYKDCGTRPNPGGNVRGHYSFTGSINESQERVTHNNTHANY